MRTPSLLYLLTTLILSASAQTECVGIIVDGSPNRDSHTSCDSFGRHDLGKPDVLIAERAIAAAGTRCCIDTPQGSIRGVSFCPGRYDTPDGTDHCEWVTFAVARQRCETNGYRLCTQAEVLRGDVTGSGCSFDMTYVWVSDVLNATDPPPQLCPTVYPIPAAIASPPLPATSFSTVSATLPPTLSTSTPRPNLMLQPKPTTPSTPAFSTTSQSSAVHSFLSARPVAPYSPPTTAPTFALPTLPTSTPSWPPTTTPSHCPTALPASMPVLPSFGPLQLTQPTFGPTLFPIQPQTQRSAVEPSYPTSFPPTGQSAPSPAARRFLIEGIPYIPTQAPSHVPTLPPTHRPTAHPTSKPTYEPTLRPSLPPSFLPTPLPTYAPTPAPTSEPTLSPTEYPSYQPTPGPTDYPTFDPTESPTPEPSSAPTPVPTLEPSPVPTQTPTFLPQPEPTALPTSLPTLSPTTLPTPAPTRSPTPVPTQVPSPEPTYVPSSEPTHMPSPAPTPVPSSVPTIVPSVVPTGVPSAVPSPLPTQVPTPVPTQAPTLWPTSLPTLLPTFSPTAAPTLAPTFAPTKQPTFLPTTTPTFWPTTRPTAGPSVSPTYPPPSSAPTWLFSDDAVISCERYVDLYSRYPPALELAIFADTGDYVQIFLDPPANISSWIGLQFGCETLFNFVDANVATCSFANAHTVNAIVTKTRLLPGNNITVHPGLLKRNCDPGARCECDQFANSSSTTLQRPLSPVIPVLILSYPDIASACNSLQIDASRTTGSGGRPMSFTWFAAAESSLVLFDIAERAADVDSLTFSSEELLQLLELFYESGANETTIDLTIRVEANNFLGSGPVSANLTVQITSIAVPVLISEVQEGLELSTAAGLDITSYAKVTDCADRPLPQRNINWTSVILDTSDRRRLQESSNLTSISSDPRRFKVAPHTLVPGANYTLIITAVDAVLGLSGFTNISVRVVRSELNAVISGGNRLVAVGSNVSISAAESSDPDVASALGAMAGLTFTWRTVPDGVIEAGTSDETLSVRFQVAGSFVFIVTVTSADGRSATTSAVYTAIELESFLPTVTISSAPRVSNGLRLILGGSIGLPLGDNSTMMRSTWSVEPNFLADRKPLSTVATTAISIIGSAKRTRRHDLVLPAGSLAVDTAYNFRLEAAPYIEGDENIESSSHTTFASVFITASRQPTPGVVVASPNSGVALQTSFTLSTSRWTTREPPLKFFFESIVNASTQRLSPAAFSNVLRNTWLPAGNPNLTLVAVAIDTLGGRGKTTTSVLCQPNNLSTAELATTTDALLQEAAGSFSLEGLAQLVVAASGSAASDSNLTETLVAQLFSASETQDDDSERVELSSGALASAASNPMLLDLGTAMNALSTSRNLAEKSLKDGITEATAASLSETLSNILNTSLFGLSNSSDGLSTQNTSRELTESTESGSGRSSTQNSSRELTQSIDSICRSQLVGTVEGENAQTLDTANIKTASSRYSRSAADGALRALGVSTGASAELPNELGVSESGYEAWFATFSTNLHSAEVGGDIATTPTLRFGLASPENDSVAVTFNLATKSLEPRVNDTSSRANLTCDCGFYGNVTHLCPDGTALSYACEGLDATFEVLCPRVESGCLSWNVATRQWTGDDCEVVPTADGSLRCSCKIQPTGSALDISSRTSVTGSLSAYASSLRAKPNFGAAFEVFLALACLLTVSSTTALVARRLDKRDAEYIEKGMPPPTIGEVSVASLSEISNGDAAQESKRDMKNSPRYEELISGRQLTRFASALKRTHPFLAWFYVYDNLMTRTSRVWMNIGVEVLTFFFALAIENNLFYPDPGCSDQDSQRDCLDFPKAAKWMPGGGHDMCEWHHCSETCTPYLPDDTEGTKPANLLTLCIVIFITMPLLRLFGWLHENYLGGQFPMEIENLYKSSSGSPPSSEQDAKSGIDFAYFGQASETYASSQLGDRTEAIAHCATQLDDSHGLPSCSRSLGMGASDNSVVAGALIARHDYDKEWVGQHSAQRSAFLSSLTRLAVEDEADIKKAAMDAAPDVAASVEQQGAELSAYIHELENRSDAASKRAILLLRRLRKENLQQWGYSAKNRVEFVKQVRLRLEREIQLFLRWHRELCEIRIAYQKDDKAYDHLARKRFLEYNYVLHLNPLERHLYYTSLNRVGSSLDPPQRPPLKPYLAAVVVIVGVVAVEVWYLLQTAFLMGKRRSRLWLIDAVVTLAIVYGIMVPSGTFFFMVWVPNLLASHVSRHRKHGAKEFPFSTTTPNALSLLLARHPELCSADEVNPAQTTIQGETLNLPDILANISEYINAELWKPPPDTRLLIIIVGSYSFLPEDIQTTIFEEIVCFTPFLSSQIMASAKYRARGVDFLLTLVTSYFLLFVAFVIIESIRLLIRKSYLKFHTDPTVRQLIW